MDVLAQACSLVLDHGLVLFEAHVLSGEFPGLGIQGLLLIGQLPLLLGQLLRLQRADHHQLGKSLGEFRLHFLGVELGVLQFAAIEQPAEEAALLVFVAHSLEIVEALEGAVELLVHLGDVYPGEQVVAGDDAGELGNDLGHPLCFLPELLKQRTEAFVELFLVIDGLG